jgi:hypothetical protein
VPLVERRAAGHVEFLDDVDQLEAVAVALGDDPVALLGGG